VSLSGILASFTWNRPSCSLQGGRSPLKPRAVSLSCGLGSLDDAATLAFEDVPATPGLIIITATTCRRIYPVKGTIPGTANSGRSS
jgi:hypothetical protein